MQFPSNRSERLVYREWNETEDLPSFIADFKDSEVAANLALQFFPTETFAIEYAKKLVKTKWYQICLPPPATDPAALPRRIGDFGLHPTGDPKDRRMKVAILISKEEKGKGYGREAIMYAMGAAFNWYAVHRLTLGSFEWNVGAIGLYESLGFVREGIERDAHWFNGKFHSGIRMSILESEYRERYEKEIKA